MSKRDVGMTDVEIQIEQQAVGTAQLAADDPHPLFGAQTKKDIFDRIDVDSSGSISKDEFVAALLSSGPPTPAILEAWDAMTSSAGTQMITRRDFSLAQWPDLADALKVVSRERIRKSDDVGGTSRGCTVSKLLAPS